MQDSTQTRSTSTSTSGNSVVFALKVCCSRKFALTLGQVEHTLSFVEAVRLLVLEGGEVSDEDYSELLEAITDEILYNPSDEVDSIMGRWGYWWVMK
jgi:hypothetical protein